LCLAPSLQVRAPVLRQIQRPPQRHRPPRSDRVHRHADLTVTGLPQRPRVLALDARRVLAVLGKPGVIQHPRLNINLRRDPHSHRLDDQRRIPRTIGHKLLHRLTVSVIAHPRPPPIGSSAVRAPCSSSPRKNSPPLTNCTGRFIASASTSPANASRRSRTAEDGPTSPPRTDLASATAPIIASSRPTTRTPTGFAVIDANSYPRPNKALLSPPDNTPTYATASPKRGSHAVGRDAL